VRSELTLAECFAILKLPETASFEAVKAARLRIIRELHPDQYADKPRLKEVAEDELKRVNAAFEVLERYLGQGSPRDGARRSGTEKGAGYTRTYSGDPRSGSADQSRTSSYGAFRSESTHSSDRPRPSASGGPPSSRSLARVVKRIAKPLLLVLLLMGVTWFGLNFYETQIVEPWNRLAAFNHGKRYDPLEAVFAAPLKNGEGFVCPGTTLHGGASVQDQEIKRPLKVKVIEKFGANGEVLGVKIFDGQGDIDDPHVPEFRMYTKDLLKTLPCPTVP